MDLKNTLAAVSLSAAVIVLYGLFFAPSPKEIKEDCFSAALSHNPAIGKIDPYLVAQYAVLEGCAKTVSVGATPIALTDCLCFGNPEKPEEMWQFSQSCLAIRDVCDNMHFNGTTNLPIVAGNVSFYNQSGDRSIPASPMIGCFGKIKKNYQVNQNSLKKFLIFELNK